MIPLKESYSCIPRGLHIYSNFTAHADYIKKALDKIYENPGKYGVRRSLVGFNMDSLILTDDVQYFENRYIQYAKEGIGKLLAIDYYLGDHLSKFYEFCCEIQGDNDHQLQAAFTLAKLMMKDLNIISIQLNLKTEKFSQ